MARAPANQSGRHKRLPRLGIHDVRCLIYAGPRTIFALAVYSILNPTLLHPLHSSPTTKTLRTLPKPEEARTPPTSYFGAAFDTLAFSLRMAEQTLNVPQLIVFVVLAFLGIRWYLRKPAEGSTRAAGQRHGVRVDVAQIDQVAQMFPQLDRRQIAWDLQRNGGNVSATTERILTGRQLDTVSTVRSVSQPHPIVIVLVPNLRGSLPRLSAHRYHVQSPLPVPRHRPPSRALRTSSPATIWCRS